MLRHATCMLTLPQGKAGFPVGSSEKQHGQRDALCQGKKPPWLGQLWETAACCLAHFGTLKSNTHPAPLPNQDKTCMYYLIKVPGIFEPRLPFPAIAITIPWKMPATASESYSLCYITLRVLLPGPLSAAHRLSPSALTISLPSLGSGVTLVAQQVIN